MPETRDTLLGGRVTIMQPAAGYRAAIDPVLLAAAVPAKAGDRVLDVGSGTGAAALALAARVEGVTVIGLELDAALAALADKGAALSSLSDRVRFVAGDLLAPPAETAPGAFDHVMANPPYRAAGEGRPPPDAAKRAATVEGAAALSDWLRFALISVGDGGTITVIHRHDRAPEAAAGLGAGGAGDLVVFPLWVREAGGDARRAIVRAVRGGAQGGIRTAPGLVLHGPGGGYTADADAVLRHGGALTF